MDITKFIVSHREKALLYGDHSNYWQQLSTKLVNCRKKLNIATKNRGKFDPKKSQVAAEQIAENHEYLYLQLLTAERTWAQAMSMKATHSADAKGITGRTKSQIVSRLVKGARTAEQLAEALSSSTSGASSTDILEARAYAALLRGASQFENRSWEACLKNFALARIIYSALVTSAKVDIYKDLLSETIDPSIRYASYQAKIPRTAPLAEITLKAFQTTDSDLVERINALNPAVLQQGGVDAKQVAPATLDWRGRQVKIEDAAISSAWASVGVAKGKLAEKLSSAGSLRPKDKAGAYDDILAASQDAVDATKQAIDELKSEGVPQGDSRMQSLQITRTAVNYETISWRIGRNRVLIGEDDGSKLDFGATARRKQKDEEEADNRSKNEAPGRQIARLKEKIVLYDGILQNLESIKELPGVANDQDLSARLSATSQYFTALKSLAISRSHSIAGNAVNALALIKHSLDLTESSISVLGNEESSNDPKNIQVTKSDLSLLKKVLTGELQRSRALVEISNLNKPTAGSSSSSKPLSAQLSNYAVGGVDLHNIITYPPKLEPIPVKPLFLDVAWNYIEYPDKRAAKEKAAVKQEAATAVQSEAEAKPQKKGWFGFGR
ncbi:hypothetical protein QBC44DRAFT_349292 [Cladorrhinum sp. PSN332]|nr:hypothetical protein QBC44DRAFT_349292 [Cladorrhinum sp. PSN332]